jgi:hypothetical protein
MKVVQKTNIIIRGGRLRRIRISRVEVVLDINRNIDIRRKGRRVRKVIESITIVVYLRNSY